MKRAILLSLFVLGGASEAYAVTHTICLRIPVTLEDETGMPGEIGTSGNWKARGIRMRVLNGYTASQVMGWTYASASSGCATFSATNNGPFLIQFQPRGQLADSNELQVRNDAGVLPTYSAGTETFSSGGTHVVVVDSEWILPRMYAITAYAIQSGFRGQFDDETLVVYYNRGSPCSCDTTSSGNCSNCACRTNGVGRINICPSATDRKFVIGHEYGHLNLSLSTGSYTNNCGGGGSGHGMRSAEWDSCAAMEGWAHFVAVEVWNDDEHDNSGDPPGWMRYWGSGLPLIDVEGGAGGGACGSSYRKWYAQACHCWPNTCDGWNTELDWMRTWWDYYTDDAPGDLGNKPSPHQLHAEIKAATDWGSMDACPKIKGGIRSHSGQAQEDRFWEAAYWNGAHTYDCYD